MARAPKMMPGGEKTKIRFQQRSPYSKLNFDSRKVYLYICIDIYIYITTEYISSSLYIQGKVYAIHGLHWWHVTDEFYLVKSLNPHLDLCLPWFYCDGYPANRHKNIYINATPKNYTAVWGLSRFDIIKLIMISLHFWP